MRIQYEYDGTVTSTEESFGSTKEHITQIAGELAESLSEYDEAVVLMIGRKGNEVEFNHLISSKGSVDGGVDIRRRTTNIEMSEAQEALNFLEKSRHILHVDCNDFRSSDINEIVIDVGNPDGEGHSFTLIPNEH